MTKIEKKFLQHLLPEKPLKPDELKSVKAFKKHVGYTKEFKRNEYPCLVCNSFGRVVDPDEQPDPMEGYRNADRIICPECGGGGLIPRVYFYHEFKQLLKDYATDLQAWEKQRQNILILIQKLKISDFHLIMDLTRKKHRLWG